MWSKGDDLIMWTLNTSPHPPYIVEGRCGLSLYSNMMTHLQILILFLNVRHKWMSQLTFDHCFTRQRLQNAHSSPWHWAGASVIFLACDCRLCKGGYKSEIILTWEMQIVLCQTASKPCTLSFARVNPITRMINSSTKDRPTWCMSDRVKTMHLPKWGGKTNRESEKKH